MSKREFSFKKGYGQIQQKHLPEVRKDLMQALGVNNRVSLSRYKNGLTEPKLSQAEAVEQVFSRYGITDIWGE